MFNSIREYFSKSDQGAADRADLTSEARQFKTPGEWFPQLLKVIFFIGLGAMNVRLFHKLVPGAWGYAIGTCAVMAEALALYCSHNFSRAAGLFRIALGASGALLMAFTIVHSVFSFFDLIGVNSFLSTDVHGYAQHYAFPFLACLLGASAIAITMTHPKNIIRLVQARAHTDILTERAAAASKLEIMRAQSILASAELDHQRERNAREEEYLTELSRQIRTMQQKVNLVAAIPDAKLRDQIARELGLDPSSLPSVDSPRPSLPSSASVRESGRAGHFRATGGALVTRHDGSNDASLQTVTRHGDASLDSGDASLTGPIDRIREALRSIAKAGHYHFKVEEKANGKVLIRQAQYQEGREVYTHSATFTPEILEWAKSTPMHAMIDTLRRSLIHRKFDLDLEREGR